MRTSNYLRVFVLLIFVAYSVCSFAQQRPKLCGIYKIDQAALQKAKEFESRNSTNNAVQSASFVLRVYFHILNCSDGTLPAATAAQITTEFNTLEAAYSANNICFVNAGFNNIYDTKLDTNFNATSDDPALFNSYRVPNCINVFYLWQIKGNNNACSNNCGIGGTSLSIPNTFCLISKGNIGAGQTVAHEVGHCMGLLHTFEPSDGYEDIDGSNSSSAGDQITDTPADPFAYQGQSCYSTTTNGCTYTGSCKDPKNASNFTPPYTNLMAYWWAGSGVTCYTSLALTSGQYTRVNSYLNTNSDLQNCESPANVTLTNIGISSGYLMSSAINTLTTTGNVLISGNAVATLGGHTVLLEPGFDANTANNAFTLIRISQCTGTPNFAKAETLKPVTIDKNGNTLLAYPNPTSGAVTLAFTLAHAESKLSVQLYDENGKLVKTMALENLLKGKNTANIDMSKFSSGIYAATIQGTDMLMKVLIAVQK